MSATAISCAPKMWAPPPWKAIQFAIEVIRESGRLVGEVLAALVNFYNPDMIVIGGGVSNLGNLLLSSIRQAVFSRSLPLGDPQPADRLLGHRAGSRACSARSSLGSELCRHRRSLQWDTGARSAERVPQ